MNVTIFSLKNEKGVYATSINKSYTELFKLQRNMDLFNVKEVKMNKYEFMAFNYKNSKNILIMDYLYDSKSDMSIEMATTVNESDILTLACNNIHSIASSIENHIHEYSLKEKYLNIITSLTSIITEPNESNVLNIDTFALFYQLFRNTFSEYADKLTDKDSKEERKQKLWKI